MGTKTGKELKQTGDIKIESIMIEEPKRQERFGLTNIGNTCYMNASIQFLKSVPAVNKLIRNAKLANVFSVSNLGKLKITNNNFDII